MSLKAKYNQAVEAPPPPIELFILSFSFNILSLCTIATFLSSPMNVSKLVDVEVGIFI